MDGPRRRRSRAGGLDGTQGEDDGGTALKPVAAGQPSDTLCVACQRSGESSQRDPARRARLTQGTNVQHLSTSSRPLTVASAVHTFQDIEVHGFDRGLRRTGGLLRRHTMTGRTLGTAQPQPGLSLSCCPVSGAPLTCRR